jgi:hypothetical protein
MNPRRLHVVQIFGRQINDIDLAGIHAAGEPAAQQGAAHLATADQQQGTR